MFKRTKGLVLLLALSLFLVVTAAQTIDFKTAPQAIESKPANKEAARPMPAPAPIVYGIPTDSLAVVKAEVERGQTVSEILTKYNISPTTISELAQKSKDVFSLRRINSGRSYTILHLRDPAQTAQYFIYEPSETEYVIYDLRGELAVTKETRQIDTLTRTLSGEIKSSLFESIVEAGGSPQLVNMFADIYAWRLDLNRIQPGDKFKLIYEEQEVNGQAIGFGKLKAAFFDHEGDSIYAIAFEQGNSTGYYDQHGNSLKKAFLREPLEYSRVSSRFTSRRFHPVQKRYKPHLGTDFAARRGTPIRTVGDGVVQEAGYTSGNGYYVKIKHNKTYTTQYLHMTRYAKGMRPGTRVKQGQTIGYVGSTGLATGPHLCYRFWKNGRQVDALRVKLPSADPVDRKHKAAFAAIRKEVVNTFVALDQNSIQQELLASGKAKEETEG